MNYLKTKFSDEELKEAIHSLTKNGALSSTVDSCIDDSIENLGYKRFLIDFCEMEKYNRDSYSGYEKWKKDYGYVVDYLNTSVLHQVDNLIGNKIQKYDEHGIEYLFEERLNEAVFNTILKDEADEIMDNNEEELIDWFAEKAYVYYQKEEKLPDSSKLLELIDDRIEEFDGQTYGIGFYDLITKKAINLIDKNG